MSNISSVDIPNFLAASTKLGLRRLMLINNMKHNVGHKYFNFYYDPVAEKHCCWFQPLGNMSAEEQIKVAKDIAKELDSGS